jgi:dUTP pyrophosphatase
LPLPSRATPGSAGYDVASAEEGVLAPQERRAFATGFSIAMPEEYECQIRTRSGLALKHGIIVANTPATIDSDYRGEVKVLLVNLGEDSFVVTRGARIAQIVFARVARLPVAEKGLAGDTQRGSGGFGSTGTG